MIVCNVFKKQNKKQTQQNCKLKDLNICDNNQTCLLFQHLLSIYPNIKMMLFFTLTKERKQSGFGEMA